MSHEEAKRFVRKLAEKTDFRKKIRQEFVKSEVDVVNHEGFDCSSEELREAFKNLSDKELGEISASACIIL